MPNASKRLQVKMKMKSVRASGTTLAPRGPMESSTWVCTAPTANSQAIWNLPGTPLVALERRTRPRVMTMRPAMTVAQTMSILIVSPKILRWRCSPGVMSMPIIGVRKLDMRSGTSTGVVGGLDGGRRHDGLVVVDHVGVDDIVHRGHRAGLGHRAGHVDDQDDLEGGQSAQHTEPEGLGKEGQAQGDHRDHAHAPQRVDGQRALGVVDVHSRDLVDRYPDEAEVE